MKETYCPLKDKDILYNNYTLEKKLGEGGFCSVWKAHCKSDGKYYAVKVYKSGKYYLEYFENELKIISHLQSVKKHPNVISYVEYFPHMYLPKGIFNSPLSYKLASGMFYPCIVMDLLDIMLHSYLKRNQLELNVAKDIIRQVLKGLKFIHKNDVIHGDIGTHNIMIKSIDQDETVKKINIIITDFNSSSLGEDLFAEKVGTKYYYSPEMILEDNYNEKADIWSLGCVVYEILTGNMLFDFDEEEINDFSEDVSMSEIDDNGYSDESSSRGVSEVSSSYESQTTSNSDESEWSKNYAHLSMIYMLLGKPPKEIIDVGRDYINRRGKMIHNPRFVNRDIKKELIDYGYSEITARDIAEFLFDMLNWVPEERLGAKKLLKNKFLKDEK